MTHLTGRMASLGKTLALTTLSGVHLRACPTCHYELASCPSCGVLQCKCIASIPLDGKLRVHAGIRKHWR